MQARLTHTMDAVCRRWLVYSAKPALPLRLPRHRPGAGFLSADAPFAAEPVVCGDVRPGITRRNPPLQRAIQLTLNAPNSLLSP